MNITVIGRGNIGGGPADLWERAGHQVTRLGRGGGDVGASEAVLLAIPGTAVEVALSSVVGLEDKTVLDTTNLYGRFPASGRVLLQRRVRQVGGGRADGEGVQHPLRLSPRADRLRPCTAEQPVIR